MNKDELKLVVCQYCGKEFKQRRVWQKFCSSQHKSAYHNEINLNILREAKNERV